MIRHLSAKFKCQLGFWEWRKLLFEMKKLRKSFIINNESEVLKNGCVYLFYKHNRFYLFVTSIIAIFFLILLLKESKNLPKNERLFK